MDEFKHAIHLANDALEDPRRDPDSDLSLLARQFLRAVEKITDAPLCETCKGLGYVVYDAAFDPYAVECPTCSKRRAEQKMSALGRS